MKHHWIFNNSNTRISFAVLALTLIAATHFIKTPEIKTQKSKQDIYVTIFVHGIISVKPFLSFSNFIKLVRDNIADSTYARTVEIIRKDPFFYQYHAMQEIGLHPIDLDLITPGAAATAYARTFHELQPQKNEKNFKYYTFGWSGLLSPRMRYLEAKLFYQSISTLDNQLKTDGYIPHYTVVAYSHGGNVAFKMGDVHENENYRNPNLSIDNLWLIGVPVLPDSLSCLYSPLFKEIVHIYSVRDRIQPLDCFAANRFFSSRIFTQKNELPLPPNLTQIQLRIRRPINKTCSENYECYDDLLITALLRNSDPGHTELWSFGWASSFRTNHPFYPLPSSVFMPYFIQEINANNFKGGTLSIEVHPYCQKMIIRKDNIKSIVPFLAKSSLQKICDDALMYKPADFCAELYKQKILDAMHLAKKEKRAERTALTPKK